MTHLLRFPIGHLAAVSVLCLTILSDEFWAQVGGQSGPPPASIKVITLAKVEAQSAADVLKQLFKDLQEKKTVHIAVEPRTNAIIVSSSDEKILQSVEAVLLKLDQTPAAKSDKDQQPRVFHLRNTSAFEAHTSLRELLGSGVPLISADQRSNTLIVNGKAATLKLVAEILKVIDAPPPRAEQLRVRVVWLVNAKLIRDEASAPPKELGKVIEELKKTLDIGELKLAAQTLVNINDEGSQFSTSGSTELDGRPIELGISGIVSGKSGGTPKLHIEIESKTQGKRLCRIKTQITAPTGHPVVLGVTTINSLESIFVVQILSKQK